jgi:formate/nitrite transporter FocA (FNT family)
MDFSSRRSLMTFRIAIGGFPHLVAGKMEGFPVGQFGIGMMISDFVISACLENIVGGIALFALISHAQVMNGISRPFDYGWAMFNRPWKQSASSCI